MIVERSFLQSAVPGSEIVCDEQVMEKIALQECTVSIDSRTLVAGQLFLALEGESCDGHDFLGDALSCGAAGLIIKTSKRELLKKLDSKKLQNSFVFLVPDTLVALLDLARVWRARFTIPVIAVTGSVGKTTTKEMIKSICEYANVPVSVSYKNQNTLVGICLTILTMNDSDKAAIFEVGISQKGEMKEKVELLRPTIGVVTTVGHAHMGGLGQLPEVAQEKRAIFTYFKSSDVGVIFGDNQLLADAYYMHPVIRFGTKTSNHVQARKLSTYKNEHGDLVTRFVLKLYKDKREVTLATNHKGNVCNALAASAVANLLKIPFDTIIKGLEAFSGFEGRFQRRRLLDNRGTLISDCCNANPESMRAALLAVEEIEVEGEKIAVLGDMLELGEKELFWHRQVGRVLRRSLSVKKVILVGELAREIAKAVPPTIEVSFAHDWQRAAAMLKDFLHTPDSLVLVKGSFGMSLHNLVNQMCE